MKILFLSDDFPPQSFGGAGIVAFRLAKAISRESHEVRIITTVRKKEEEGSVEYEGLTIYKVYANYHDRFRAYVSLLIHKPLGRLKV